MKQSDIIWIQSLAAQCLGHAPEKAPPVHIITQSVNLFIDELCGLITEYSNYMNELIADEASDAICHVFKLGAPRPGMMLLRGKDKLVISAEGTRIRCKVVQVQVHNERHINAVEFEGMLAPDNEVVWICLADHQRVNPELVAKLYIGKFLALGSAAFDFTVHASGQGAAQASDSQIPGGRGTEKEHS
jgi:hypothetical protein